MKKLLALLPAFLMLFMVSCSDSDDPAPAPGPDPEPAPSPTYKPSLYYLGIDTTSITQKYTDMTGQMLEVRYYLNTNMNKLPVDQLTIDEIGYYYCYFTKDGEKIIPHSAQGTRRVKEGKDLVSHSGHQAMFGDYKMPKLENILSLDQAIKIVKDAAAAPDAVFECPRTGEITLHRPVDPTSAGRLFYTFADDGSGKYSIAVNAYTGELDIRLKPTDPSPTDRASLYWIGMDTTAIEAQYPEFDEYFKYAEYTLDANINTRTTSDQLSMKQIDYFYSKEEGSNADLCQGTRTLFDEGTALSNVSKSQGAAINYMSIPALQDTGGHAIDQILEKLFDDVAKPGAKFTLPATNKVKLYVSPYTDTLGEVIYDFGIDGSGKYIITYQFHSGTLYLEQPE